MAGYSSVRARTASSGYSSIAVSYQKYRSTNESMYGVALLAVFDLVLCKYGAGLF